MNFERKRYRLSFYLVLMVLLVVGCNPEPPQNSQETAVAETAPVVVDALVSTLTSTPGPDTAVPPTSTSTPTPDAGELRPVTTTPSKCVELSGEIEVQVLVGPAEATGLEPVAVGSIPFQVVSSTPPYIVEGDGGISYDAVLEREWGTYAVTLLMDLGVEGECLGMEDEERLSLTLKMNGEQMVVVDAKGFHGEYPWEGERAFPVEFPLQEGATVEGEGWSFVLHLGGR